MTLLQFEIQGLTKTYNGKKVLDIPYLDIKKGSILALMGPNGAGKTTLLSILGFLLPPTSGKVYFEGMDTEGLNKYPLRQKVTLTMQNPFLFDTTVEKNLAYGLRLRGIKRQEQKERVRECLKFVGLAGFENKRARDLSGGEIQRIAIARSLILKPEVLLLDEPTANIDRGSIDILERILKEVNRNYNTTIVLATHDINQAYRLADEVISLSGGKLAEPPVENLLRGKVLKDKDLFFFDTGKIKISILPKREEANYISIPPEDILISHTPISTSARNSFLGKIAQVLDEADTVKLIVDVGEQLKVKITKSSFKEMGLSLGSHVYLTFKSSSAEIF